MTSALKNQNLSRRLIRLLKDIMAGTLSSEKKVDYILRCIAAAFSSDTISLYGINSLISKELILIESKGIKLHSFEKKILPLEDGLVGKVFDSKVPLYIEDTRENSDSLLYVHEFITFLGVPLLRGGKCIGVLAIQSKEKITFTEDTIEALEIICVTLSEIIVHGFSKGKFIPESETTIHKIFGIPLSHGIGIGAAYCYIPERISHKISSQNSPHEMRRFKKALEKFNATLEETLLSLSGHFSEDQEDIVSPRDIIESYRMFSQDKLWIQSVHDAIHTGLTVESALQKVLSDNKLKLFSSHESFTIEVLYDIEDFTHRLLNVLVGDQKIQTLKNLDTDFILVAKSLGPAELLDYHHPHLKGIILEEGSTTAHVAIIARALGIPVLGWTSNALAQIPEGKKIILDATSGFVHLRPTEPILKAYMEEIEASLTCKPSLEPHTEKNSLKNSCISKDEVLISLSLNAALNRDLRHLEDLNADGIGLFRTEIPFMLEGEFPDVETQTHIYKKIFNLAKEKPIIFRILDIGGDKPLPYFNHPLEPNPILGWRALRVLLDRPSLLKHQIRSLIRASHGKELNIMFPMVSEYVEFEIGKNLVFQELEREISFNRPVPSVVNCGITLEVPALAWHLPKFIHQVDFVSIGSNDLFQFFFACDRGNPILHNRYDTLSPSFLSFLKYILEVCTHGNVPLSFCGDMASRPLEALTLVALGFRNLSLSPSCFHSVKKVIENLDIKKAAFFIEPLLESSDHSLRKKIKRHAQENLGFSL